mgnify:CR=1 FL=1
MKVVLDIETDGFNPSKIHCIVAKDVSTNTVYVWDSSNMYGFKSWTKDVDKLSLIHI